jgi:hypothetical protein
MKVDANGRSGLHGELTWQQSHDRSQDSSAVCTFVLHDMKAIIIV